MNNLAVVLVHTRFPENIGMAARACANMGCEDLRIVAPELWSMEKAAPLATAKGLPVLENIRIFPFLADALADVNRVFATTARTGGWRRKYLPPWRAAEDIAQYLQQGEKVALVFGPEDKGLDNRDITECQSIIHIPTPGRASSLNLAQAVLLVLYECSKTCGKEKESGAKKGPTTITMEEQRRLEREFKEILLNLECLHGNNPDYFFIQWQNIFSRAELRRHEYDALMGFCRQIRNKILDSSRDLIE